jgi:ADP-ribose diphosphatase
MSDTEDRQKRRRARYETLRAERPHLFTQPAGANPYILFDPADQDRVARDCASRYEAAGIPVECADIGVVYEDPYVLVIRDAVRFDSGRENSYVRVVGTVDSAGAAVLPLTDDERIVLIRHFRHEDRAWRWEIPRGFGEAGSDGAATAVRELDEELHVAPADLTFLGCLDDQELHLARLDGATRAILDERGDSMIDADEGIDGLRMVTASGFREMMLSGEIVDAFTLAAFAFAVARGMLRVEATTSSDAEVGP